MNQLTSVEKLKRKDVVPYYVDLIKSLPNSEEVIRVNQLILSKWSNSGLLYIKEKAWASLRSTK